MCYTVPGPRVESLIKRPVCSRALSIGAEWPLFRHCCLLHVNKKKKKRVASTTSSSFPPHPPSACSSWCSYLGQPSGKPSRRSIKQQQAPRGPRQSFPSWRRISFENSFRASRLSSAADAPPKGPGDIFLIRRRRPGGSSPTRREFCQRGLPERIAGRVELKGQ